MPLPPHRSRRIGDPVGSGRANRPADVPWAKDALACLGRYSSFGRERHGFTERELDRAIRGYQNDRGLRQDGYMQPGGETESTIRAELTHDFNPGQPGSPRARILQRAGEAAPFGMSYSREEDVRAELEHQPDGRLVLRKAAWGRRQRDGLWRWLRRLLAIAAIPAALVLWFLPPVHPCRMACGQFLDDPIHAALRPNVLEDLRRAFGRDDIFCFMLNGRLYATWFNGFDSLNREERRAFSIASGWIEGGPPPAVRRAIAAWEARHGETFPRDRRGEADHEEFRRLDECAVRRAALTYADGD